MLGGILLDLTPLVTGSTLRGIGRYVRGLGEGLSDLGPSELVVQGLAADPTVSSLSLLDDVPAYTRAPAVMPIRRSLPRRNRLIRFEAPRLARTAGRLLHLTDPIGFPFSGRDRHCLTCHDLIPIILPEYGSPIPGGVRLQIAFERLRYRRARRILAVSHATKRDLCERLELEPDRIDVVWHGVDHRRFHANAEPAELERVQRLAGSERPYVLYVGAGDPRKDLTTLVSAFSQSRLRTEADLLIVGSMTPKRVARLRKTAQAAGTAERLKLLGYVDESFIAPLYRAAALHVFPSRYEGFGFPVVEALACGCPTITSPGSSLDEVAGDAALIVPCEQPEALARAMESAFFDSEKRAELRAKGLARAATFTWQACAEQTLAFWRRALEETT